MSTYTKIPFYLLRGEAREANVYGNNAGWLCSCGEALVGRSSSSYKYVCYCGRTYQVLASRGKLKPPDEVHEVVP